MHQFGHRNPHKIASDTMDMSSMLGEIGDEVPEGVGTELSMTFELYDYDVALEIEVPRASDVTVLDAAEFARLNG